MVEVVVIGTEPPCIRCSLLVQRVNQEAEMEVSRTGTGSWSG